MATLNTSKWGYISLTGQSTHTAARDGGTGTSVSANPTSDYTQAINYNAVIGGRGNSYNIYRAFYYFDTSGITSTVTSCSLVIRGITNNTADVIVIESTAFGTDGSSNLVAADYSRIDFNTAYSSEYTTWDAGGVNTIPLNSTALSNMQTNDYLILAVIEYDFDYSDVDPSPLTVTYRNGIAYTTTGYLDYEVVSGPANIATLSGVAPVNISKFDSIDFASISSINGVS